MAELQRGKGFNTLTGKVKITEGSFAGLKESPTTGYMYTRIQFGVETAEGNTVWCEMMGGYAPSNPIIYAMNKEDNSPFTVNWNDRLNDGIVSTVADFKLHKVGLERDDNGKLIVKSFLSPVDVEQYLKQHLKDGMEITVRGQFEFSEYNDDTQRKMKIQNIFLPYQEKEKDEKGNETGNLLPVKYEARFTQTILLTEDSFKRIAKADKDSGEVIIQARVVDYVSKRNGKQVKKNLTFPLPIVVKINQDKPEITDKILSAFFDVKKGKVREITIEGDIIEGYEQSETSSKDIEISPEIQELIDMGLYDEDEAKKKLTVRGSKVSKLVFSRPFLTKNDQGKLVTDINDDKYKPEDLFVNIEQEETGDSLTGSVDETTSGGAGTGDTSWMNALGI
ncbi:hypothetical protein ACW5UC_24695 [Priestia aryabhattai]|uniref:hypothetical protein n=1 Tax=Priestia megaterium TaxID=1404 RepID=UPI003F9C67AB